MSLRWFRRFLVVAGLALAALPAVSQDSEMVDPYDARSPSGNYALHVDPSTWSGLGPAIYTLMRDGEVLWSRQLDYTLRDVVVGDDGAFAGSAQRRTESHELELMLLLLNRECAPLFQAVLPREWQEMHGPEFPYAVGNLLIPELNRIVFRVVHYDSSREGLERGFEVWRVVDGSTGKEITQTIPARHLEESRGVGRFAAVQSIRGTPLIAAHGLVLSFGPVVESGAVFAVFDLEGTPVWERREALDYVIPNDEQASGWLWYWVTQHGVLLDCSEPKRFEFALAREGKRVLCELTDDPARSGQWLVNEIHRADYQLPFRGEEAKETYPPFSLEPMGTIELQGANAIVERIWNFDIDDRGRLGAIVTADGKPPRFVLRDAEDATLADIVLRFEQQLESSRPGVAWLKSDRWLIYLGNWLKDQQESAWWLDLPGGQLTAIQDFDCAPIEKADGTFDGGFVALTTQRAEYTNITSVCLFDAQGQLKWQDSVAYGQNASGLLGPEAVAVSTRGEIGVLDNSKRVIHRFDKAGKLESEIDLAQALGRDLSYPTDLGVDPDGNWVVCDFNGTPPILRVTRDGQLSASFEAAYADGRTFSPPDGIRVAPDGSLWASDGFALVRLDASGVVDRVAGDPPAEWDLGEVELTCIDAGGRILLADKRTHAVHVFDSGGRLLTTCKLDPRALDELTELGWITSGRDGSIHVGVAPIGDMDRRYFGFDANGVALGSESFTGATLFQRSTGRRWQIHAGKIRLYDPDGALLKETSRSPDDRWLTSSEDCAVAADGTLVVESRESYHVYSPDGEPIRSLPIPADRGFANLTLSKTHVIAVWGADVWRTELATGKTQHATLELVDPSRSAFVPAWREELGELWLADPATKKVRKYRVKD